MFVVSMKTTRSHLLGALAVVALLLITMVAQSCLPAVSTAAKATDVTTEEGRRAYLTALGYEVGAQTEVREVLIPAEEDAAWTAYNALQTAAGTDMSAYRGKRVKRYTYPVTNYPGTDAVVANLYVYKETVVGGDISSTEQGGFSHGLTPHREDENNGATG